MKQLLSLMLILSITGTLYAQNASFNSNANPNPFIPDSSKITRRIFIDLDKGNRLRIELEDLYDLDHLTNIDSLLMVFVNDMKPFKDSMNDQLASHRIDYASGSGVKKKIRIFTFRPAATSYLLDQNEPAALKLEQDTINILVSVPVQTGKSIETHKDRITIYINQYQELPNYITGGLNEKFRYLTRNVETTWIYDNGIYRSKKDPSVWSRSAKGFVPDHEPNDYLGSVAQVGIANYKSYFAPSFAVGIGLHINKPNEKNVIKILWEPTYIFDHNAQGHLQTYRNDFLELSFYHEKDNSNYFHNIVNLSPTASLAYLIRRRGDYFDKNTFRLGIGGLRFFDGGLHIEPCLWFNNFFQSTTPGVRIGLVF